MSNAHLTTYQKRALYTGIKLFNNLSSKTEISDHNTKVFKAVLKDFSFLVFCTIIHCNDNYYCTCL